MTTRLRPDGTLLRRGFYLQSRTHGRPATDAQYWKHPRLKLWVYMSFGLYAV